MNANYSAASAVPSRTVKIISWVLRILAALAFLAAGGAKLAGVPMMVGIYEQIGFGQWFRIVTGVVEVIGAIGLLIPATAAFGGLLLAITMTCAVLVHIFVTGGSPAPAATLLAITATVAWLHRASFITTLARLP